MEPDSTGQKRSPIMLHQAPQWNEKVDSVEHHKGDEQNYSECSLKVLPYSSVTLACVGLDSGI